MSVLDLARPELRNMRPYTPGAYEPGCIRLNANESPWRTPGDTTERGLNVYPPPRPTALTQKLSAYYGIEQNQILVTRGSSEAIDVLIRGFCAAGHDSILVCPPTFDMYRLYASIQGAEVRRVPLIREQNFALDTAKILGSVDETTKIIFICSPNNPTGQSVNREDVDTLCREVAGQALVVIDEAYHEFADAPNFVELRNRYEHVVLLRTLSKFVSLAGVRCGLLIAAPELVEFSQNVLPPYTFPTPSIELVLQALSTDALRVSEERVALLKRERRRLAAALLDVPQIQKVYPSDANFILVKTANGQRFREAARRAGVLVRTFDDPLLNDCVRITVGRPQDNDRLLQAVSGAGTASGVSAAEKPMRRILFVDRDGTLIVEPEDKQIDSVEKVQLMPGVIPALLRILSAGFELVIVSNQDGLGTASFPQESFEAADRHMHALFASQGIRFAAVFICPHLPAQGCACRKPAVGLVRDFLAQNTIDRQRSAVIGDRETDLELARNIGLKAYKIGGAGDKSWADIAHRLVDRPRIATVHRKTRETDIRVDVDLDSDAEPKATTGIGFFDHMLEQLGKHAGFKLNVLCTGDLHIDEHHTVEDVALTLGQALREALGDKRGIQRYGFLLPMDEADVEVSIDLGGRPFLVFEAAFPRESVGGLPTELVPHFFRSLAETLGAAIHIRVRGDNTHHMIEVCFKGVARALRQALVRSGDQLPTTKGQL